jgi:hypothetical protein
MADYAEAQSRRMPSANDEVRQRRAAKLASRNPYWDGFILKHEGNCSEAIDKLRPLAKRGFGFEGAQTALGECYLDRAGLSGQGGDVPPRADVIGTQDFKSALLWLGRAANAGHFEAQANIINLYAVGLGPDKDNLEAAKWAHLYLTNPQRLNLGVPVQIGDALAQLQSDMDKDSWLLGKERARIWVPVYLKPEKPPKETPRRLDAKKP